MALLSSISLLATAPHLGLRRALGLERPQRALPSGLLTDRLSAEQLERWREIERLVLAEDARGGPLYPTLRGLWEWADASGHAIYLELPESSQVSLSIAGMFKIERLDPQGARHVVVIRLYLENIDRARLGPKVARKGGFVPFKKLGKVECYAEVLGHELVHTADILSDPERARLVEEAAIWRELRAGERARAQGSRSGTNHAPAHTRQTHSSSLRCDALAGQIL